MSMGDIITLKTDHGRISYEAYTNTGKEVGRGCIQNPYISACPRGRNARARVWTGNDFNQQFPWFNSFPWSSQWWETQVISVPDYVRIGAEINAFRALMFPFFNSFRSINDFRIPYTIPVIADCKPKFSNYCTEVNRN